MGKHFVRLGERTDALYTINDIRERNVEAGLHFFDADTVRFFRSRFCGDVFQCADGSAVFVSSESWAYLGRRYSIRRAFRSGRVITVPNELAAYETRRSALAAARRVAADAVATARIATMDAARIADWRAAEVTP